jgi:hypothetical protein
MEEEIIVHDKIRLSCYFKPAFVGEGLCCVIARKLRSKVDHTHSAG